MQIENRRTIDYQSVQMIISEYQISLQSLVDRINERKWVINKELDDQGKEIMFNTSWEYYNRDKVLSTPVVDDNSMKAFAEALYISLFDDTRIKQGRYIVLSRKTRDKYTLGDLYYENWVQLVSAFRCQFTHSRENMKGNKIQPKDVYSHYYGKKQSPQKEEEYKKLQTGLLNDYISFLEGILKKNRSDNSYFGRIETDRKGLVHTSHILLPKELSRFSLNECYITWTIPNNDPKSQNEYPYFCNSPEYINCNIVGEVSKDVNTGVCSVGGIKLDSFAEKRIGKGIRVLRVRPIDPIKNMGYTLEALMIENITMIRPKKELKESNQHPSVVEGQTCTVEIDDYNRTHVGNVLILANPKCNNEEIIKLKKIVVNAKKSKVDYPFVALKVERVDISAQTIQLNVPYIVEVDKNGVMHVGNVYIDSHQSLRSGYWVSFETIEDNNKLKLAKTYPKKGKVKTVIKIETEGLSSDSVKKSFWKKLLKYIHLAK